jgi:hypothetical protein
LSIEIYISISGPKITKEIKSVIDYVITKQMSSAQVMDVRVFRGAERGSDHCLVKVTKFWPLIKEVWESKQGRTRQRAEN